MVCRKLVVSIGLILALCSQLADGRSFLDRFQKLSTVKKSEIPLPKQLQLPRSQPKGLFDWSGDEESIKELRLASISLIKTALSIAMYGMAWTWFKKSLCGSLGSVSDFLRSQGVGVNTTGNISMADIQPYIMPNSTFSEEETAVLCQFQLPSGIESSLDDLGGLQEIKQNMLEQFFVADKSAEPVDDASSLSPEGSSWWKTEVFESKHSALLFGPPGCGKTSLVRGLCRKMDCPMLAVTPSMIQHQYFGESTKQVRTIFSAAKKLTRCVIFVDELDAMFSARKRDDQSFERSVKTEFIQAWDNLLRNGNRQDVFVFGATNRPHDLDPAILRRFERSFLLPLPDDHDRMAIWKALLADVPLAVTHGDDFDFARCAKLTEGFCTTDIRQLCEMALGRMKTDLSRRLRPLYIQDIEDAADVFVPTTWVAASFGRGTIRKRSQKGASPRFPFASTFELDQYRSWSSPSPFDDDR